MGHSIIRALGAAVIGTLVASSQAAAADCSALGLAETTLKARLAKLVADNPGVHLVLGSCGALAAKAMRTARRPRR